jgi:hypothetical protein
MGLIDTTMFVSAPRGAALQFATDAAAPAACVSNLTLAFPPSASRVILHAKVWVEADFHGYGNLFSLGYSSCGAFFVSSGAHYAQCYVTPGVETDIHGPTLLPNRWYTVALSLARLDAGDAGDGGIHFAATTGEGSDANEVEGDLAAPGLTAANTVGVGLGSGYEQVGTVYVDDVYVEIR